MADDMSNLFSKVQEMLKNGDIPPELQKMASDFKDANPNFNESEATNTNSNANNTTSSIDPAMMFKMTKMLGSLNNSDDSRAKLLNSLKPYLRDNKKGKLDQYVNLLKMSSIVESLKDENKEK